MKLNARLRYHVTGAIERGEAVAIEGMPEKLLFPIKSPLGAVWFYCDKPDHFPELATLGFSKGRHQGREVMEGCVMSGCVAKAEQAGFETREA